MSSGHKRERSERASETSRREMGENERMRVFRTGRNDGAWRAANRETEERREQRRCRTIRTPKVARGVCQVKLGRAGRKIGGLKAAAVAPYPPRQPLNLWRRDNVDAAFCMLDCYIHSYPSPSSFSLFHPLSFLLLVLTPSAPNPSFSLLTTPLTDHVASLA